MAVMNGTQRQEAWGLYMSETPAGEAFSLTKVDLRAALDAVDDWISNNAAAFNTALPVTARTALSAAQKARLLLVVVRARYLDGV